MSSVAEIFDRYGIPQSVWNPIMQVESGGNPTARSITQTEDSIGLFQLNRKGGLGRGYSVDQLQDPSINAEIASFSMAPAYRAGAGKGLTGIDLIRYTAYNSGWPTNAGVSALTTDPTVQAYDKRLVEAVGGSNTSPASIPSQASSVPSIGKIFFIILGGGLILLGVKVLTDVPIILEGGGSHAEA